MPKIHESDVTRLAVKVDKRAYMEPCLTGNETIKGRKSKRTTVVRNERVFRGHFAIKSKSLQDVIDYDPTTHDPDKPDEGLFEWIGNLFKEWLDPLARRNKYFVLTSDYGAVAIGDRPESLDEDVDELIDRQYGEKFARSIFKADNEVYADRVKQNIGYMLGFAISIGVIIIAVGLFLTFKPWERL